MIENVEFVVTLKICLMDFTELEKIEVQLHHHTLMNVKNVLKKELKRVVMFGNTQIGRFHVWIPH